MSEINELVETILAIHAAASIICALTPTQRDDEFLAKAYKLLECLALNVGKAKR